MVTSHSSFRPVAVWATKSALVHSIVLAGARHADVLQRLVIDILKQIHLDVVCLERAGILAGAIPASHALDVTDGVSSSSNAFASFRTGASKPSVNQL